ncbi:MAG TPA: hypothetical protein VF470_04460, partial [Sphingomicrobium sp.]
TFRGELSGLRSALTARGWSVEQNGYVLRLTSAGKGPPPLAPPAPPQPQPQPAQPAQTPPAQPPRGNE